MPKKRTTKHFYILRKTHEWGDCPELEEYFLSLRGAVRELSMYLNGETEIYTEVYQDPKSICKRHYYATIGNGKSYYEIWKHKINP